MVKLGTPIEIHPHEALLSMLYIAAGHVAWLREEISALRWWVRNDQRKHIRWPRWPVRPALLLDFGAPAPAGWWSGSLVQPTPLLH